VNTLANKPFGWMAHQTERWRHALEEVGAISRLLARTTRVLLTTRFEPQAFLHQMQQLGVRSLAIAGASSVFVGIVMTIQFAVAMEKWGARDTLGKVIVISEARELAPALTALVVGSRVAAGMAAELGSMAVTEQIDAIRALGADPIRKLVVPRLLAGSIVLPLTTVIAFCLAMTGSLFVATASYGIAADYFVSTATLGRRRVGLGLGRRRVAHAALLGVLMRPFFMYDCTSRQRLTLPASGPRGIALIGICFLLVSV
jgi:phospholipid/cholesterol/gamma-HCH transport system permease protein